MTENDLRESLKTYLAPADLPDSRKRALLAHIRTEAAPAPEKGESNMFRPNKFRMALVVAAIVTLLTFTVALAAGFSGYVNIKGEPVEAPTNIGLYPAPTATPTGSVLDKQAFAQQLVAESPADLMSIASYLTGTGRDTKSSSVRLTLTSIEQLADYLPEGIPLPSVPEGFSFLSGHATLVCIGDSEYELVNKVVYGNGVSFYQYRIPEGKAVMDGASITLWDGQPGGHAITFVIALNSGTYGKFPVDEGDTMEVISLPGMDDALYLHQQDIGIHSVYARILSDPPLTVRTSPHIPDIFGQYFEQPAAYDEFFYAVTSWDSIPVETLTSMFK